MKKIRLLLDANISPETAVFLRSLGFNVKSLIEEGLGGIDDSAVLGIATREKRVVITFDLDFGERYFLATLKRFSVIVLRLDDQRIETANAILEQFLNSHQRVFLTKQSRLAIVREREARIL